MNRTGIKDYKADILKLSGKLAYNLLKNLVFPNEQFHYHIKHSSNSYTGVCSVPVLNALCVCEREMDIEISRR